jgi:hypothetical protein
MLGGNAMNVTCDEMRRGHEKDTTGSMYAPELVTILQTRGVGCLSGSDGNRSSAFWHRRAREAA